MAEEQGFAQVLWLDGVEKKYVEEVGSMNIMFKIDGKIYTAPCTGTVLPGVTRRSIIELLRDWGYEVCEEHVAHRRHHEGRPRRQAGGGLRHRHRRRRLPGQGAGLEGRQGVHQRRQDRRADPEAVRHSHRHPVGQDPRHQGLDRPPSARD